MQFRTQLEPSLSKAKFSLEHNIFSIGSCFADTMGQRLSTNKFNTLSNPFGIIFNPVSIAELLDLCLTNQQPSEDLYLESGGVHSHYLFHSSFSGLSKQEVALKIQGALSSTKSFLQKSNWLILTLGTAMVYQRISDGRVVANCHKQPAAQFVKRILSRKEILSSLTPVFEQLRQLNPKMNILLTVSPVRHSKDTLEVNSASKAVLRLVCETLRQKEFVHYFPSFEIVMDDLRDYRFFESDLVHPNKQAQDYIWDIFQTTYFDPETRSIVDNWVNISSKLNHKPFHPSSQNHQLFLTKLIKSLADISSKIDVTEEIEKVKKQIL